MDGPIEREPISDVPSSVATNTSLHNHILYIIAEAERKWIPTIKEALTKFRHV